MPRPRVSAEPPQGLVYRSGFLTAADQSALVARIELLDFEQIVMKGVVARRSAVRYGYGYDYDRRKAVEGADAIPDWLFPVRDRGAELAGLRGEELVQVLIQRYPPGAPIGWHRDSPSYELVVGVSLLSAARMRFRRGARDEREVWETLLEPGSAYVLAGDARWSWEHHVPPARALRYSITFRSLRGG